MKTDELLKMKEELKSGEFNWKRRELFGGADVIVCKEKLDIETNKIMVISNFAIEISTLIFELKDLFKEQLDYLNKYEFYGRIAIAANRFIAKNGDSIGVLEAMIEEAINIDREWGGLCYFAYGSNMDKEQMADRCPGAAPVCKVEIPDYKFALDCSGAATIVKDLGSRVQGVLWIISEQDEKVLDRYEGVGKCCYKKETLAVETKIDGNPRNVNALVYISLRDLNSDKAAVRSGYMERIVKAVNEWDFDKGYIEELETHLRQ